MAAISLPFLLVLSTTVVLCCSDGVLGRGMGHMGHDYGDALTKSILFYEGQRSGKLPMNQRLNWRKDSALVDGREAGADLVGGYYDAGDNVKFGFPLAFTTTVLSWSIIEFGEMMGPDTAHAQDAVRWATDYLLKATAVPNKIYVQVGDPVKDHNCWERPEDMDTPRTVYAVDSNKPGSEVAAETAAALAAASIVFKASDPKYADILLQRSFAVFDFADKFRGSYNDSVGSGACPFYCDYNGYEDELVWGAAWIHKASRSQRHWDYINNNIHKLDYMWGEFGYDAKHAGAFMLLYKEYFDTVGSASSYYHQMTEKIVCNVLPESPLKLVKYTPGGLLIKNPGQGAGLTNPIVFSFLMLVQARYLANAKETLNCGNNVNVVPERLIEFAKTQMDYVLGDNPRGMSYMVGYGPKFPQFIHHRASSLPSVDQHPAHIPCYGTPYFASKEPNPNQLTGAVVSGPDESDAYTDTRELKIAFSEPATYVNAPLVGLLAYFKANNKG